MGKAPRGVTLLELLVVTTVLGVVAALAVPQMMPTVARVRHQSAAMQAAGFLDVARRRAVADGRCYRVLRVGTSLIAERRAGGDCVDLSRDAALAGAWIHVATLVPEQGISFVLAGQSLSVPPGLPTAELDAHRLVFRPNGRLWGDGDLDVTDDGARILVQSLALPSEHRAVHVSAIGRICLRRYAPSGLPPTLGCS